MGLVARLTSAFRREEGKSLENWRQVFSDFGFPSRNFSAAPMTPQDALGITAVWAACRVIADGVAQVPFKLFRATENGREPARDHPLYDLITVAPSSLQTSYQMRETLIFHAGLTGDAVFFVDRVGNGREVREIIPITPARRRLEVTRSGDKVWRVRGDDDVERIIPSELIWQVSGPSWDAVRGLPTISLARRAFNLAAATEEAHERFFSNGAKVSGTYSVDGTLSPEQYEFLRKWIKKNFTADDAYTPMILDRGATFTPHQMTGTDAQAIETRKHQIEEIGRAFRVMPIMIGQSDKAATYASAEQMFIAHVVHTLSPWYSRIEQSADKTLLTRAERQSGLYFKFIPNGLMRGAAKDRAEFYSKALGGPGARGWMTPDEVREHEDMNRLGGEAAELMPLSAPAPAEPTGSEDGEDVDGED